MSYDHHDAEIEAGWEAISEELYEEHFFQAVEDFKDDRLVSYYKNNPELIVNIKKRIDESRKLLRSYPSAAYVFSVSAIEVCTKNAIIRPLIHGFINDESAADLIAKMVFEIKAFDKFQKFALNILKNCVGIDLSDIKKNKKSEVLWKEIKQAQEKRNLVLHRGESVEKDDARNTYNIAKFLLNNVFISILKKLGLGINKEGIIGSLNSEKGVIIDTPTRLQRIREKKSFESLIARITSFLYRLDSEIEFMSHIPKGSTTKDWIKYLQKQYPDIINVDTELIFTFKNRIKTDKYTWSEVEYEKAEGEGLKLIECINGIFQIS